MLLLRVPFYSGGLLGILCFNRLWRRQQRPLLWCMQAISRRRRIATDSALLICEHTVLDIILKWRQRSYHIANNGNRALYKASRKYFDITNDVLTLSKNMRALYRVIYNVAEIQIIRISIQLFFHSIYGQETWFFDTFNFWSIMPPPPRELQGQEEEKRMGTQRNFSRNKDNIWEIYSLRRGLWSFLSPTAPHSVVKTMGHKKV